MGCPDRVNDECNRMKTKCPYTHPLPMFSPYRHPQSVGDRQLARPLVIYGEGPPVDLVRNDLILRETYTVADHANYSGWWVTQAEPKKALQMYERASQYAPGVLVSLVIQ